MEKIYLPLGKQVVGETVQRDSAVVARTGEEVARLRTAISRISRRLRPTAAGSRFTRTEVSVLEAVAKRGPIRLSDLANAEGLNPTMVSRLAGHLEGQGLIRREPHPGDGRAALVNVTSAGRRLFVRIQMERTAQLNFELSALDDEDRACVLDAVPALERLAERLKDVP
jgi:DNA-binding MarR family transcriptional regulator